MASNSWNFGTSNPNIEGRVEWWATPRGAVNNYSDMRVKVMFRRTNWGYRSWGTLNTHVRLDTQNGSQRSKDFSTYVELTDPDNWAVPTDDSGYRVYHNSDGKKSCSIRVYGDADFGLSFDSTKTFNLDSIPRYTSITSWGITGVSPNSITINWNTADTISNIVCQFNGTTKYTASPNERSGTFTIGGLSEATTYSNIKIIVTRKDSGLTTTSNAGSATTSYYAPTSNISLQSYTINSIQLAWSSNFTCDYVWVYRSGTAIYQSSVNATSGSINLLPAHGISPGTNYSLTIQVRRAASKATAMSSAISLTTLAIPTISSSTTRAFNIGSGFNVYIQNYSNNASTISFQMYNKSNSWETILQQNVAKGVSSISLFPNANTLYQNCVNSNTIPTRVACTVSLNGVTYPVAYFNITGNVVNSNPDFSGFSWETNVGTSINSLIGGIQNMITNYGNLRLHFNASSATPKNAATISSLETKLLYNSSTVTTVNIPYSANAFTYDILAQNITAPGTYTIQILAIDSRGNRSASVSHSFTAYIYHNPKLSITMQRQNNFEAETYLQLTGQLAKLMVGTTQKNAIMSLKYRYAESGGSFSDYQTLTYSNATVSDPNDFAISIDKSTTTNYFIKLAVTKSYVFQFELTDKLYSSGTYEIFVGQGQPPFLISDDGYVIVDKEANFNSPAKLQVGTDIMARDSNGRDVLLADEINTLNSTLTTTNSNLSGRVDKLNSDLKLIDAGKADKAGAVFASDVTVSPRSSTGDNGHIHFPSGNGGLDGWVGNCANFMRFYGYSNSGAYKFLNFNLNDGDLQVSGDVYTGTGVSLNRMSCNNLNSPVNLFQTTLPYRFPCEGYLYLEANYRPNYYVQVRVFGSSGANWFPLQASTPSSGSVGNTSLGMYVKAGMMVGNLNTNDGNYNRLKFFPLC